MRPTAAIIPSFFLTGHRPAIRTPSSAAAGVVVVAAAAADPCKLAKKKKKKKKKQRTSCQSWRTAAAGSDGAGAGGDGEDGRQSVSTRARGRRARLSARRRESIRLLDVLEDDSGGGGRIGEFLRHPAGVESLLNTGALQSFAPVESSEPGTFRCTLDRIGFLGFQVAPVLDLRVTPTCTDCTVEMLSCRFEGSESIEQQNELFSAVMRNHITWGDNNNGEEPCLDIDVSLEISLEVYTKPFSLLPLSAVEKPGNLLMQSLLDRLVPMLGEQLLRDYRSWVQQQQQQPESSS